MTSGVVLWCGVKSFGITFLGNPRSKKARLVHSIPFTMKIGMGILAIFAIVFGIFSPFVIKAISNIVNNFRGVELDIVSLTFGYELTYCFNNIYKSCSNNAFDK